MALSAVSSKSRADLGSTDLGSCTKLLTESGTGSASTSCVIFADCALIDVTIVPILPRIVVFAAASAAICSFVLGPVAIPGGVLTPSALRKFNAPERRRAFVPRTAPIKPTKPNETAPKIMPREELSAAAAAAIGIVAFKEGDALAFANKFGIGVPERLIVLIEEDKKEPDTEIDIERVGEIDREFDILFAIDEDGVGVLPGEGETVVLVVCVGLIEDENDPICDKLILDDPVCDELILADPICEELILDAPVCEGLILDAPVCEGLILDDPEELAVCVIEAAFERVCDILEENDGEELGVCVFEGVIEAIIHV